MRAGMCELGITAFSELTAVSTAYEFLINRITFHGYSYLRVLIRREKILQIPSVDFKKTSCLKLE